ncbi:hypothetical protein H4219_003690 [Mycoemilia scoparia]|uniref:Sphingomyelin synthase-like domain-containing protein n=1 Tax=Mycoemilia scoparia TaxID=417184 RepID=A0A9W8A3H8_9FUNG|nr:hypothetical protein H4219_003690 [Mycoemilia scoparia]
MANVASQRSKLIEDDLGFRPTLPDVGFEFIGYIKQLWLTDLFDILMFIPTVLLIITHPRPWRVISRTLLAWGLASLVRITTVAITSVPDPRPGCEYVEGNVFTHFTLHRCGDAIYSGHTLIYIICGMVWASFSPRKWLWRGVCFLIWCGAIAGSVIVLANRAHYSIDVLLAWYIGCGCWYLVAWFWYWQVTKKGRLLLIEFPMGVGRHRESDTENMVRKRRLEIGLDENGKPFDVAKLLVYADNASNHDLRSAIASIRDDDGGDQGMTQRRSVNDIENNIHSRHIDTADTVTTDNTANGSVNPNIIGEK